MTLRPGRLCARSAQGRRRSLRGGGQRGVGRGGQRLVPPCPTLNDWAGVRLTEWKTPDEDLENKDGGEE